MNTNEPSSQTSLSRRGFIGAGATLATVAATSHSFAGCETGTPVGARVPGIQLYTVRDSMAEDDIATLTAIAAMGYKAVEFAGYFDRAPENLRSVLDDLGLASPSAHVDARAFRADPGPIIEAASTVGHEYLTIAWLLEEDRRTLDDYRRWADTFNRLGEACRAAGLRFAYHNHDFELLPLDGELPLQLLIEQTDATLVDFELDFFWVVKAGRKVPEVLDWAPGRCTMAHIKDMDAAGNMVDLGAGEIDFATLLASDAAASIRHPFVEHDNPANPMRTAAIGRRQLSAWLG